MRAYKKIYDKEQLEYFKSIVKGHFTNEISDLFYKVSQKLKTKSTQDSWDESIEEEKFYLNLKNEDINLIKSLGNTLGKTDKEGQMSGIHQFNTLDLELNAGLIMVEEIIANEIIYQ